nr:hypothetical protein L204_05632 [Cryptococcus depauperatus CBS 7855]
MSNHSADIAASTYTLEDVGPQSRGGEGRQGNVQPHILNHAWSNPSLTFPLSQHGMATGLGLDVGSSMDLQATRSRRSSFSSMTGPDDKFGSAPLPVVGMEYVPPFGEYNPLIATSDLFLGMKRQQPKLAVQTEGLGKTLTSKERSAGRSAPYGRNRSESSSLRSEEGDDIASLISASTNYSTTPWSTTSIAGGFNDMSLHRRTCSNTYSTLLHASPSRPMLSRAGRSTSMVMSRQKSQPDFRQDVRPFGSAAERQESVRKELAEQAEEVKRISNNTQQDKARALWVRRWLLLSYTRSEPHTVPRQGLYHSYTISCKEHGLKPINSASFGKAVRGAYPGIKTRRLGVRGNSKYHYVSIRPAIQIEAERLNAYGDSSGAWHVAPEDGSMNFHLDRARAEIVMEGEDVDDSEDEDPTFGSVRKSPFPINPRAFQTNPTRDRSTSINNDFCPLESRDDFIRRHTTPSLSSSGGNSLQGESQAPVYSLPGFPTLAVAAELSSEIQMDNLQTFWNMFCQHQEILADCIRGHHFDQFEMNASFCRTFWSTLSPALIQVCLHPTVSAMIFDAIATTYDYLIGSLLENLSLPLPAYSQSSLRNLAEHFETIMEESLGNFPSEFYESKVELCARVAHLFIRFIDLHQLTTALGPILANQSQVQMMLTTWENLDIRSVSDQCALSCHCQQKLLETVLEDYHQWLKATEAGTSRTGAAIESLGDWINTMLLKVQHNAPRLTMSDIVVKVGFVTSQVMRDFTLKSDPSFGLFQLVKTWVDDWVSIVALRKNKLSTRAGVEPPDCRVYPKAEAPSMSVFIPLHSDTADPDLTTAMPFSQKSSMWPQSITNGYQSQYGQYHTMPHFNHEDSHLMPRPLFSEGGQP